MSLVLTTPNTNRYFDIENKTTVENQLRFWRNELTVEELGDFIADRYKDLPSVRLEDHFMAPNCSSFLRVWYTPDQVLFVSRKIYCHLEDVLDYKDVRIGSIQIDLEDDDYCWLRAFVSTKLKIALLGTFWEENKDIPDAQLVEHLFCVMKQHRSLMSKHE